jgi:hypothetical protein
VVAGLKGPVLVMEYLENSSLSELLERLKATETLLPNMVLLAFSLSVVSLAFSSLATDMAVVRTEGENNRV